MTDREALFRAILDNPDDDTLRLIFADALEEAGEENRAAFIRKQVEIAGVPEYDPAWIRYRYLEREKLFGDGFEAELPLTPAGFHWASEPFRRGFPAAVQTDGEAEFVEGADELFARAPIDSLEILSSSLREARGFAECPWRNRLVRLSMTQGLGGATASRLFGTTGYERLTELHIGAGLSTQNAARELVRSRAFKQLIALSCRDDRAGGQTLVSELIQLADPPRLKKLDVSGNRLSGEELRRLVAAPALSLVEDLDLSDNSLGPGAFRSIAEVKLPHLRSLRLQHTWPEEEGIRAISGSNFLEHLKSLNLRANNLASTAAAILISSSKVSQLRVLDLSENRLGDGGTRAIAGSHHLQNLLQLDLSENLVEDGGADALASSPHLAFLLHLDLRGNIISPELAVRLKERFGERLAI